MSDDTDVIAELSSRCPGWHLLLADGGAKPLIIVVAKRVIVVDIRLPEAERSAQVRRAIETIETIGDAGDGAQLVLY